MHSFLIVTLLFLSVTTHNILYEHEDIVYRTNGQYSFAPPPDCPQHIGPPCPRFYNNTMPDYIPGANTTIPDDLKKQMSTTMETYINMILTNAPPTDTSIGTYIDTGIGGQAVLFLRLYTNTKNKEYLNYAQKYLEAALKLTTQTPRSNVGFLGSYTGIYTMAAIIYAELGDTMNSQKYIGLMQQAIREGLASTDDTFDTGRSGTIMAAKMLNNYFGANTIPKQDIITMAYQIFEDGVRQGTNGHLAWKNNIYPDIVFWGQGHGSTGAVQQLLDIPELVANETVARYLKNTLDYYLTLQLPDGNFPTPQVPPYPPEPDVLVQWCHGAPGFMPVLTLGYKLFGNEEYLKSAQKAADAVWERGILTKGLMLCHGVSGNTYMFLYMYKQTNMPQYLYRAIKFQEYTLSHPIMVDPTIMRKPTPSPYMFFQGSYAGAIVLWSDMLSGNSFHMPGFEPYP